MNKDTTIESKNQTRCDITFENCFSNVYQKLDRFGEKNQLHLIIAEQAKPFEPTTIRAYCSDPRRIPEKNRKFFYPLMAECIYHHVQERISVQRAFCDEIEKEVENLKKIMS